MQNKFKTLLLIVPIIILLFSCSRDDEQSPESICFATDISMVINGESHTFHATGRGIDLNGNGYTLSINLDSRNSNSANERTIMIQLPYKKTGVNLIEKFIYHHYINQVTFDGDFTDSDFQSNVLINRNTCFYATFSGRLNDGNQEINITNGKISYQYEIPFSN